MIYASLIGLELFHNRRGCPTSEGPSAEEPSAEEPGRPPGRLVKVGSGLLEVVVITRPLELT